VRARLISALRAPAILLAVYLLLAQLFAWLSAEDGLIKPSGSPDLLVAAVGLAVILLRLVVLFVLPAVVIWRLVVPRPAK
jgi:hypothetical protein